MGLRELHHLLVHISVWIKLVSLSPTAKFVLHIWEWLHFWLTCGLLKPYRVVSRWWTSSPLRQEPPVFAFPTAHCTFCTVIYPAAELTLDLGGLLSRRDNDRDHPWTSNVHCWASDTAHLSHRSQREQTCSFLLLWTSVSDAAPS